MKSVASVAAQPATKPTDIPNNSMISTPVHRACPRARAKSLTLPDRARHANASS